MHASQWLVYRNFCLLKSFANSVVPPNHTHTRIVGRPFQPALQKGGLPTSRLNSRSSGYAKLATKTGPGKTAAAAPIREASLRRTTKTCYLIEYTSASSPVNEGKRIRLPHLFQDTTKIEDRFLFQLFVCLIRCHGPQLNQVSSNQVGRGSGHFQVPTGLSFAQMCLWYLKEISSDATNTYSNS